MEHYAGINVSLEFFERVRCGRAGKDCQGGEGRE